MVLSPLLEIELGSFKIRNKILNRNKTAYNNVINPTGSKPGAVLGRGVPGRVIYFVRHIDERGTV